MCTAPSSRLHQITGTQEGTGDAVEEGKRGARVKRGPEGKGRRLKGGA